MVRCVRHIPALARARAAESKPQRNLTRDVKGRCFADRADALRRREHASMSVWPSSEADEEMKRAESLATPHYPAPVNERGRMRMEATGRRDAGGR